MGWPVMRRREPIRSTRMSVNALAPAAQEINRGLVSTSRRSCLVSDEAMGEVGLHQEGLVQAVVEGIVVSSFPYRVKGGG